MTTRTHTSPYAVLEDRDLIRAHQAALAAWMEQGEAIKRMEWEMEGRMKARNATAILDDEYDVRLERKTDYDQNVLVALREIVSPEMWAAAWIPEETKVIPGRLDVRKAQAWLKAGGEIPAIIERAKVYGAPKLSVKKKGGR